MALVLLVEPDQRQRDDVRATLRAAGHSVDAVTNAADAERALAATGHDFVICDVSLPDGSGLDFVERLEGCGRKAVGFVPQSERLLIEVHDSSFFCRPFSRDCLMALIERGTRGRESGRRKSRRFVPPPVGALFEKLRSSH